MGQRTLATLVATVSMAIGMAGAGEAFAAEAPGSPGSVRFMKGTNPEFDRFTNDGARYGSWMNDTFFRMRTYTPYFDGKTSWYSKAWVYRNLYGIGTSSSLVTAHPEWILKDGAGRKLYIPWGCSNGTCPLYAGDFGSPGYRAWWISEVRKTLQNSYKGVWIDDVNMVFRAGNGNGNIVAPIDPRTGAQMSETQWRSLMADFLEQIRTALPDKEIVHNAIWYSPENDSRVARALRAADYINLERGINDSGITRGGGTYGYETFLKFIDRRHADGHGVVFDSYSVDFAACEYGLASYFLVNNGRDVYSSNAVSTPEDFWSAWRVKLGAARGSRYAWNGLVRRDFASGLVLVNQPQAPTVTVSLGGVYTDLAGRKVTSVRLGPAAGAVLQPVATVAPPVVPPTGPLSSTPTATPSPATTPTVTPAATTSSPAAPQPPDAQTTARKPAAKCGDRRRGRSARVSLRVKRSQGKRRTALVCGTARDARGNKAKIRLHRKHGNVWRLVGRKSARVDLRGQFRATFSGLAGGRYRADAAVGSARASRFATAARHFVVSS